MYVCMYACSYTYGSRNSVRKQLTVLLIFKLSDLTGCCVDVFTEESTHFYLDIWTRYHHCGPLRERWCHLLNMNSYWCCTMLTERDGRFKALEKCISKYLLYSFPNTYRTFMTDNNVHWQFSCFQIHNVTSLSLGYLTTFCQLHMTMVCKEMREWLCV